jgi:arylsulfatase A-like enzyme
MKEIWRVLVTGFSIGSLVGMVRGIVFIIRNRYLSNELYTIAVDSLLKNVIETIPVLLLIFLIAYLIVNVFHRKRRRKKGEEGSLYNALIVSLFFVTLALHSGYNLNRMSGYPAFWSATGVIYNGMLTIGFILFGWFTYRVLNHFRSHSVWFVGNRKALLSLAILVVLAFANPVIFRSENRDRANILFITVDTLRADHLGCYGYPRETSPSIDRLAERGILFERAVVQWPKTSPSFASIMTSTYGHENGVTDALQRLEDFNTTVAEILYDAGYNTVGITGNANVSTRFNFDQGFAWFFEPWDFKEVMKNKKTGCDATTLTNLAIDWLVDHGGEGNFFLWIHYIDPHSRYMPPPPYDSLFINDEYYDTNGRKMVLNEGLNEDIGGVPRRAWIGEEDDWDYYISQYDGEIRYMDDEIRRLIDTVEMSDLWDDLLVILTADHGESLGEHNYYFEHGRLPYDPCAIVPLILSGGVISRSGVKIGEQVALLDLFPTILDYAGEKYTGNEKGLSLRPLIENRDTLGRPYVFMESGYEKNYQRTIRNDQWKLIYIPEAATRNIMTGNEFELYNLQSDPEEINNVIDKEQEVANFLKRDLFVWMAEANSSRVTLTNGAKISIDKATEEHLRAMGYIQ